MSRFAAFCLPAFFSKQANGAESSGCFYIFIRLNGVIMHFCCIFMQFSPCRSPTAYLFGPRFRQVGSTVLICGKHGGHVSEASLRLFRALNPAVSRWNFCPDFDKPLSV